jgi:hypothetical protein
VSFGISPISITRDSGGAFGSVPLPCHVAHHDDQVGYALFLQHRMLSHRTGARTEGEVAPWLIQHSSSGNTSSSSAENRNLWLSVPASGERKR